MRVAARQWHGDETAYYAFTACLSGCKATGGNNRAGREAVFTLLPLHPGY